jgi:hypothetical protein
MGLALHVRLVRHTECVRVYRQHAVVDGAVDGRRWHESFACMRYVCGNEQWPVDLGLARLARGTRARRSMVRWVSVIQLSSTATRLPHHHSVCVRRLKVGTVRWGARLSPARGSGCG